MRRERDRGEGKRDETGENEREMRRKRDRGEEKRGEKRRDREEGKRCEK
jgi:hypothetical protein